jgi:hypothetical protein
MLNEVRTIGVFDIDNDPVKISVSPLPNFISINRNNFTIKPTSVGSHTIRVKLQDTWSHFSEYNLTI